MPLAGPSSSSTVGLHLSRKTNTHLAILIWVALLAFAMLWADVTFFGRQP